MPKYNKNQYSLDQVYAFYCSRVPNPVSFKEHKKILEAWGDKVVEYLVAGKDVKLHGGLSLIGVRKYESQTYTDHQESKRQGKLIKKSNVHSGFYAAKIYWRRRYTKINSSSWTFVASRNLAKAISSVMKVKGGHLRFSKRANVVGSQYKARQLQKQK
ncbi:MAG: hypothetical protein KUG81_01690, partial [Gammaproteobacteria bacterium]|nr:hypothetical protein [Gammaproteobacteria bacterium]